MHIAQRTSEKLDTVPRDRAPCANTLPFMEMDALLTLISLVSFFALVLTWIAAPLRAAEPALIADALTEPVAA